MRTFGEPAPSAGLRRFDVYDTAARSVSSAVPFRPVPFRYVRPAEPDLMTRLAGMRLR
ncbi:hypothetical protein Shyhy01_43100 [Streptomyces hygroscopicus subsp. hygroscopicus]|nr:hypothetical protein Shyhy01_43100 [Streptomyces hygroscopicus subsp. hygroscopicus]